MKINTKPMTERINSLLSDATLNKPQKEAMSLIRNIISDAQNSAYSFPPRPRFTYQDNMPSALFNELSDHHLLALHEVGIEFYATCYPQTTKVVATFYP